MKRISKNDMIFIGIIAVAALAMAAIFFLMPGTKGAQVLVTVSGETYGSYPLDEDQEVDIVIDGAVTNLLVIKDGVADVTEADCPDKLCVHQKSISKNNETIVCLPNRVVVQVTGSEESGLDSIAK